MMPEFEDALIIGKQLGESGHYPTIYKVIPHGYAVVLERKWPPAYSYPAFKWNGDDWLLIPLRLSTRDITLDVCQYFRTKGIEVVPVEFSGVTFDIFLDEELIPEGAWIIYDADYEDDILMSQWDVLY